MFKRKSGLTFIQRLEYTGANQEILAIYKDGKYTGVDLHPFNVILKKNGDNISYVTETPKSYEKFMLNLVDDLLSMISEREKGGILNYVQGFKKCKKELLDLYYIRDNILDIDKYINTLKNIKLIDGDRKQSDDIIGDITNNIKGSF